MPEGLDIILNEWDRELTWDDDLMDYSQDNDSCIKEIWAFVDQQRAVALRMARTKLSKELKEMVLRPDEPFTMGIKYALHLLQEMEMKLV